MLQRTTPPVPVILNPWAHLFEAINQNETFDPEVVWAKMGLTAEEFAAKAAHPTREFVMAFAEAAGTKVAFVAKRGRYIATFLRRRKDYSHVIF